MENVVGVVGVYGSVFKNKSNRPPIILSFFIYSSINITLVLPVCIISKELLITPSTYYFDFFVSKNIETIALITIR